MTLLYTADLCVLPPTFNTYIYYYGIIEWT